MDTYKDRQLLEDMYLKGDARWQVWNRARPETVPLSTRRAAAGRRRVTTPALAHAAGDRM
jgi:hypothetical protein